MNDADSEQVIYENSLFPVKSWQAIESDFPNLAAVNHWHSDFEFVYVQENSIFENINGKDFKLEQGNLLFINSGSMHFNFQKERQNCVLKVMQINPYIFENELLKDEGSAFGDWAFCKGPQGFSWGGTWICGAAGSDNISLIKDIMYTLTCDADTMATLAMGKGNFANNEKAMRKAAASDYKNDFLGGQNHMALFIDSAASIKKECMSMYDQGMTEKLQSSMKDYFEGIISEDEAWDNFYVSVLELYPSLHR